MNKEFIPYEQALELKELGFDEPTSFYWEDNVIRPLPMKDEVCAFHFNRNTRTKNEWICAPLYQQAFRWFRDKKLCDGSVCRHGEADGGYSYRWDIVHEYGVYEERHFKLGYKTYEEAEIACLKKLIEIVKNK